MNVEISVLKRIMTVLKIVSFILLMLCCNLHVHSQFISGRVVALKPPTNLDAIQNDISVEAYLENENAFWDHTAEIEVFHSEFPDSLFFRSKADSLGFFSIRVPYRQECYIKIVGNDNYWDHLHPPLILKRVFLTENVRLDFLPIIRNELGLSEYVSRPIRRKFIFFGKWIYGTFHEPPPIWNSYPDNMYRITYKNRIVSLTLQQQNAEIDFYEIMHDLAIKDSLGMFYDDRFPFRGDKDFQEDINRKRNSPGSMPDTVAQVKIAFILYKDGSLGFPIILESYDDWHSNEALRLFKTLPKFKPMSTSRRIPAEGKGNLVEVLEFNFSYPR